MDKYISYYLNEHPLNGIDENEKLVYIYYFKYLNKILYDENEYNYQRIKELAEILNIKNKENADLIVNESQIKKLLGRRFKFFYFFTYSYLFLIDSFLIFLPKTFEESKKICEEIKKYSHKRYFEKIDILNENLFSNETSKLSIDSVINEKRSFISENMLVNWGKIKKFENSKEKRILLTATMSAGKSSLINAIVGREVSYTLASACTSNILNIKTTPINDNKFSYINKSKEKLKLDLNELENYIKKTGEEDEIILYFNSILGENKVRFIDTPGIDTAFNDKHGEITENYIKENFVDILIYVIPVINYGSQADYLHLKWILENAKYGEILFVINKIDTCEVPKDDISKICENIKQQLENVGFKNPIVCPLSSEAGLSIKEKINKKELSKYKERKLKKMCAIFSDENMNMSKFYEENEEVEKKDELEKLYIYTGLYSFEKKLFKIVNEV